MHFTSPVLYFKYLELLVVLCRLLNETKGSLLDDEQLVNTLQTSKVTSQEVTEQLQVSEQTEVKIDAAREVNITVTMFMVSNQNVCFYTSECEFSHVRI